MFFKVLYPKIQERVRQRLDVLLAPYQKKISIPSPLIEEVSYLGKASTIEEAYHSSDQAKAVFRSYQLHACDHCSVRFDETLEEAAQAYQINLEIWQIQLNCKIFDRS